MKIYLTTEPVPVDISYYDCFVWGTEPHIDEAEECFVAPTPSVNLMPSMYAGCYAEDDLAALGFPPPGEMRVVTIPPYEEEDDEL